MVAGIGAQIREGRPLPSSSVACMAKRRVGSAFFGTSGTRASGIRGGIDGRVAIEDRRSLVVLDVGAGGRYPGRGEQARLGAEVDDGLGRDARRTASRHEEERTAAAEPHDGRRGPACIGGRLPCGPGPSPEEPRPAHAP